MDPLTPEDGWSVLARARQARVARTGLIDQRSELLRQHEQALARVRETEGRLASEEADVERLEGVTLARLLAALAGNRHADLERERAEAETARHALDAARGTLTHVEERLAELDERIAGLGDVDGDYAAALDHHEREALSLAGPVAERLRPLADRLGRLRQEALQLEEAMAAAQVAEQRLDATARLLGEAGDWSTYDTFLGGGLLADMMKYDRLDEAEQHLRDADQAVGALATELADVGIGRVGQLDIPELTRTLDVWFDNLFSDWAVRDRIAAVSDRLDVVRRSVAEVTDLLDDRQQDNAAALAAVAAEREHLLTEQG